MSKQTKADSFYAQLQKKYAGKLVAYSKKDHQVYASDKNVDALLKKLAAQKVSDKDIFFTGPIPEPGQVYVYYLSICDQNYRRREKFLIQ